jgi:hypothetical protein
VQQEPESEGDLQPTTSALKILSWEQMADLARRVGMLGLARKLKNAVAARGD